VKRSQWMVSLALGLTLLGAAWGGCSEPDTANVVRATSREIRGRVPVRAGALRVLRIVALNARTRRVVAQAEPNADGTFVLRGVTVGAPYKVNAVVGRRTVPITFPKAQGSPDKTNVFEIGTQGDAPASPLDGPIDLGVLQDASPERFDTLPENAPNLQEDFDRDGTPDGADPDRDNDGVPNAMDADNDGNGTPDAVEVGDLDGDGLTNDADPDLDGDGTPNLTDADNDNDGTPDVTDTTPSGAMGNPPDDLDGDGLPNAEDATPDGNDAPVDADAGAPDEDAGAPDEDAGEAPDIGEGPLDV
jgi:hypothetical protein